MERATSTTTPGIGAEAVKMLELGTSTGLRRESLVVDSAGLLDPMTVAAAGLPASLRQTLSRVRLPATTVAGAATEVIIGADAASQLLRELRWSASTSYRARPGLVRYDASAIAAVRATFDEARDAGVAYAGPIHLAAALLRGERDDVAGALRADPAWRASDRPHTPLVGQLRVDRELEERTGVPGWFDRRWRRLAAGGSRYGGVVVGHLLREVVRQAVRLDGGPVTSGYLLLGVASMGAQLRLAGRHLRPAVEPLNGAPDMLAAHGLTFEHLIEALRARPSTGDVVAADQIREITVVAGPGWTGEVVDAVDRAVALADGAGHPQTGVSHLVAAALEDGAGTAAVLARALGADPAAIRAAVLSDLSRAGDRS
ncbi:Clp protease N-terminal domain-containing protein [Dactylosporangium sp. NPDC000244]|uniref:Clp protease N-terminal domain-containing protein n=1 Tax=Dactylosporangium sp. NPDC000244 TaxID=3154365 RepID=UPI00332B032C